MGGLPPLPLLLIGCLARILEAPYVLATGAGDGARTLTPTPARTFLVAGEAGLSEVDGSGAVTRVEPAPLRAATSHGRWRAVVTDDAVVFTGEAAGRVAVADTVGAQAWCDDQLLLIRGEELVLLAPGRPPAAFAPVAAGAVDVALSPTGGCDTAVVAFPDRVERVGPEGREVLVSGLSRVVAVAPDRHGRIWVVHGSEQVLARLDDGGAVTVARYLEDVVDLHFGVGGLLHPDNAYLLTRDGRVEYVRVPTGPA